MWLSPLFALFYCEQMFGNWRFLQDCLAIHICPKINQDLVCLCHCGRQKKLKCFNFWGHVASGRAVYHFHRQRQPSFLSSFHWKQWNIQFTIYHWPSTCESSIRHPLLLQQKARTHTPILEKLKVSSFGKQVHRNSESVTGATDSF